MTAAPTTYEITWEHTRSIAQKADRLGMEAMVPVARWRGFGGNVNVNGTNFETFTWAAGRRSWAPRSRWSTASSVSPTPVWKA